MGDIKGFIKYKRQDYTKAPIDERVKHFNEFIELPAEKDLQAQGARCMDCGVPFCQSGCPIGNIIPDWNDLVYRGRWLEAIERLHKTNNFPEFTGRICPAPCENACVLAITDPAVLKPLLKPYPAELMRSRPVNDYVNDPKHEGRRCLDAPELPEVEKTLWDV